VNLEKKKEHVSAVLRGIEGISIGKRTLFFAINLLRG
jgi:hypothetical protein